MRTLYLFEAFFMELADGLVLAFEVVNAFKQWICDSKLVIFSFVVIALLGLVERGLELSDEFDVLSRLLGKVVLFTVQRCK